MNLNAFLSRNGVCSRRKAVVLIKEGRVTVNGSKVTEPWFQVAEGGMVKVNGKAISSKRHVYILINKPKGVTSTMEDRFADKKVTDLIPAKFGRVYPVGRLDKDSRGLMILTSDGDLCYKLTHPKFEIEKEYIVTVKGPIDQPLLRKIAKGAMDEGELLKVKQAHLEKSSADRSTVRVTICEGRKRHLRRLFSRLGFDVKDLVRIRIAGLRLGDIRDGAFRVLDRRTIMSMLGMKNLG